MRILVPAIAALTLLAACMTEEPPVDGGTGADLTPVLPTGDADTCGAAAFASLIGQPRSAAEAAQLPQSTRVLGPNDMMTMDYRPDRLNVMIGETGLVEQLTCV